MIEKIKIGSNGTERAIASTAYGYCETAASEQAKIVDMSEFKLYEGVTIHVKFQYNNTAANPTLNVNGTGAKSIVQYGTTAASTTDGTSGWYAGAVISFTYDGTYWVRDQGYNSNTWRGIQDNLTSSTNTTESLSAKQGYLLANGSARDSTKVSLVSSTDNAIVRFDGANGAIQNSGVTIDDSNNISSVNSLNISNTNANVHLSFARTGGHQAPNYINVPASSSLAVSVGGAGGSNIVAMIDPEGIVPFTTNTKSIGTSTYKWASVYATNFYGSGANITLSTASRAVVTDANSKLSVSSVTSTELGYLSGVTSAIQTQLNSKMASSTVVNKVKTTAVSNDVNYKILACAAGASPSSGSDYEVVYDTDIMMNPSTNTIYSTTHAFSNNSRITYNSACGCLEIIV